MWICSTFGFFSIVKKGNEWHVRARERRDLVNIVTAAGVKSKILRSEPADYRWRCLVGEDDMQELFKTLLLSIDYSNFKGMVSSLADQRAKLGVYSQFWAQMADLQFESERRSGVERNRL